MVGQFIFDIVKTIRNGRNRGVFGFYMNDVGPSMPHCYWKPASL